MKPSTAIRHAAVVAVLLFPAAAGADCAAEDKANRAEFREAQLSVRESRIGLKTLRSRHILQKASLEAENGKFRELVGAYQAKGGLPLSDIVPGTAPILKGFLPVTKLIAEQHELQLHLFEAELAEYRRIRGYVRDYLVRMEDRKERCPDIAVGEAWEWGGKHTESAGRAIRRTEQKIDDVRERMGWLNRYARWAQRALYGAR